MALFRSPNRRSDFEERLAEDARSEPTGVVRTVFEELGLGAWYRDVAMAECTDDPWIAFQVAQHAALLTEGRLRCLLDIFVLDKAVSERDLSGLMGKQTISWLHSNGVVRRVRNGKVQANFCLLSCFGYYLLIDWPVKTSGDRLVSVDTYLSRSSYQCASSVLERRAVGRSLEVGCGSGLVALVLAQRSRFAVAIDIDPMAIRLTRLNLILNGIRASIMQGNLANSISGNSRFDLVVVNPPWRIVPPGVAYPNPTARVGPGVDGLDYVRQVLRLLPRLLAASGETVIRFDLPVRASRDNPLRHEVEELLRCGCSIDFTVLGEISAKQQSEISAETCWHLNRNMPGLAQRFIAHYCALDVSVLSQVMCVVRNERASGGQASTRSLRGTEILHQESFRQ